MYFDKELETILCQNIFPNRLICILLKIIQGIINIFIVNHA